MKKFFFLVMPSLFFTLPGSAQNEIHEIYLGIGTISRPYGVDVFGHYIQKGAWGTHETYGTYHLGYKLHITPRQSLGLNYVYERQQHHTEHSGDPMDKTITHATNEYHTLMADMTQYWKKGKWVNLYSTLGLGACFFSKTYPKYPERYEQHIRLAYQITPLGIRVGKALSGFAEIGYGYKGVFCGGLSYRF